MAGHDKDMTLAPRLDISDFIEGAKKLESLCSTMSGDFLKFDKDSVAALSSFEKALKQLSESITQFSHAITNDLGNTLGKFDLSGFSKSVTDIRNELTILREELSKAPTGATLSEQLKTQFAGVQQTIAEMVKDVTVQMVHLAEAFSKMDHNSIRVNLSNIGKDSDVNKIRELITTLNTEVKTKWDVSSLVNGANAMKEAVNSIDIDKLQSAIAAGNKLGTTPKPEPVVDFTSQVVTTKSIVENLEKGQKVLVGWTSEGKQIREVMNGSGQILKRTVTDVDKSKESYKQATANLREQQKVLKQIGTYSAKELKANGEIREQYHGIVEDMQTRLADLQREYELIDKSTMSAEQRAQVETQIQMLSAITVDNLEKVEGAEQVAEEEANSWKKTLEQVDITITRMFTRFVIQKFKEGIKAAIDYSIEFYDQLNEIRVVTGKTEQDADKLGNSLRELGREMGVSSTDMATGAITYYRQGLNDTEVEERLRATTAYAKAAAISFDEAAQLITASTNAMGQEANHVADIFLYLGDNSASSGAEIGQAMSKAAATADAAGVSFEMLGAYIATVSEKTRQDAGSIGTALNSIMARLMSVKSKGFNDEDETKVNDIAKALKTVNIELTDGQGEWRSMSDIWMELGAVWDTLTDKQQNYLATAMAGVRQQNVFRTLMEDLAKTNSLTGEGSRIMELYAGAMDSAGTAAQKLATWQESIGASMEKITAEWETLVSNLELDSTAKRLAKNLGQFLEIINGLLNPPQEDMTPVERATKSYEDLMRIRNIQGQGANSLIGRAATAFGYDYDNMTEEDFQWVVDRIKQLEESVALGQKNVYWGAFNDVSNMIREYFSVDGVFNEDLYAEWQRGIDEFGSYLTAGLAQETFGVSKSEITDILVNHLNGQMSETIATDPDIPKIGKQWLNRILDGMYGVDWSLEDINGDETMNAILGFAEDYARAYDQLGSIVRSTQNTHWFNEETGTLVPFSPVEMSQAIQDARAAVDEFNRSWGTALTYDSFFPKDKEVVNKELQTMIEAGRQRKLLREEAEKYYETILEGINKADVARKKAGGFQEEVSDLQSMMWEAVTTHGKSFKDIYNYYMEMAANEETQALYDAFSSEYADTFFDLMSALKVGDGEAAFAKMNELVASSAKEAKEELSEEEKQLKATKEALDKMFAKYDTASQKKILEDSNWASWIGEIQALAAAENGGGLYEWMLGKDQDLLNGFLDAYPTLQEFFTLINKHQGNIGWIDGAAESFKNLLGNLPSKKETDNLKKFNDALDKAAASEKQKKAKDNHYVVERGQLMSFFANNRADIIEQLSSYQNANVDLVVRPVIDSSQLRRAGWTDEDGNPISGGEISTLVSETFGSANLKFAFTATPILPDGEVLSPDTFYEYINKLCGFDTIEEALAYDKENNNLLINWLGIPEGTEDTEQFLKEYGKLGEVLHLLHEQLYGGQGTEADGENLLATMMRWQEDGTLAAMNSEYEGLATVMNDIMDDLADGTLDTTSNIKKLHDILFDTKDAWEEYCKAAKKAYGESVPDTSAGIELLKRMKSAIGSGTKDDLWKTLSDDEQEFIEDSIKGWEKFAAGVQTAQDTMVEFDKTINNMTIADLIANKGALSGSDKWYESAIEGTDDFYKNLNTASKAANDLYDAWESLAIIQSGQKVSNEVLAASFDLVSQASGLSVEYLQGAGGLTAAEQALSMQTDQTVGTLNFLMTQLQQTGAVDFRSANWSSQLAALANDSSNAMQMVAQLTQALLNVPKNVDVSINVSQNGSVSVSGGGGIFSSIINGVVNGAKTLGNFVGGIVDKLKSGSTAAQTKVRSGGGGGSKNQDTEDNLKSEIEKMIHMMDQVQDLFKYEQSMYQAMRDAYDQDKLLQGVILYYRKEAEAIEENNLVLEDNIAKIEALLPQQQALVAAMSTTDENYKEASADLEKLQSAHQEYTKALLENQTKIKEYNQKIKETYDKIRDMEIDLRDTILKAIEDREARIESMQSARISLENEVFEIIKKHYEDERDQIIETSNIRKKALQDESSLLDENLAKRKAAAEQEDKQAELIRLQQQLVRISADPTRRAEQDTLRKQIKELQDELAWDEAEKEVEAQKESIENQIDNLEDYMDYVEEYYEDLFEHPQKLLAETEQIMNMTHSEILAWLQANNEEFANASAASQAKMISDWENMLMQMAGDIKTYWDEVEYIISQGDEYIINFLMENSADYRAAGKLQAEAYVDEWKQQLEDLRLAYQGVFDDMQTYAYNTIRLDESVKSSGSGSSSGGGGSSKSSSSKSTGNQPNNTGNQNTSSSPSILDMAKNLWNNLTGKAADVIDAVSSAQPASTSTVKTKTDRLSNLGLSGIETSSSTTSQATKDLANSIAKSLGIQTKTTAQVNQEKVNVLSKLGLIKNAAGGEHDQTGWTWIDGTVSRPERILSAEQTELFDMLVSDLHQAVRMPMSGSVFGGWSPDGTMSGNTFGDIIVNVESLDSDADYEELAERVMEEISERMNRGKAVGGIRRTR